MVRMNSLPAVAITASMISNGGVFVGAERYTVYFIRHADSIWNAHKDKTEVSEEQVKAEFKLDRCPVYDVANITPLGQIVRDVPIQKRSLKQAALMTVMQSYLDAQLSPRGVWQSQCLAKWISQNCEPEGLGTLEDDVRTDVCRLAGMRDRDRAVLAASNLKRTQQTMLTALAYFCGYGTGGSSSYLHTIHAYDFLQERGCAPDARPNLADRGVGHAIGNCQIDLHREFSQDICLLSEVEQNNVFDKFVGYVNQLGASRESNKPIFYVTGHSSWLQDFFKLKLPDSLGDDTPNNLEINLTRVKLGNASVIKFFLEIDNGDISTAKIVPNHTKLIYGYLKAEKH